MTYLENLESELEFYKTKLTQDYEQLHIHEEIIANIRKEIEAEKQSSVVPLTKQGETK